MKLTRIMIVALGLLLLGATAFAQVIITPLPLITTSTLNQVAPNAQTGLVGNVALNPQAAGAIQAGEIINIAYPAVISSLSQLAVTVQGCATPFGFGSNPAVANGGAYTAYGTTQTQTCGTASVSVTVNRTSITVAVNTGAGLTDLPIALVAGPAILVQGVRLDVTGIANVGGIGYATISSVLGQATVTNPQTPVAIFVEPISLGPTACVSINAFNTLGGTGSANVTISELFTNAFETFGSTAPTQVILNLTGIPAGFALTGASVSGSGATATVLSRTATQVVLGITAQGSATLDTLTVPLTFTATAPVSLTPGNVTVNATLGPPAVGNPPYLVGADVVTGVPPATVTTTFGPLRYAPRNAVGSACIGFGVSPLTSKLLAVFSVTSPTFETGFAVANASNLFTGANPGTITVTLYPNDGSAAKSFTTSADKKPGIGLDATGSLPAGAEWTVLLSQLLTPAGFTGTSFQGMVTFSCNFSDAHGVNFIADPSFENQSQGYPMLVIGGTDTGYNN